MDQTITQEQIKELKAKHGDLFQLDIKDADRGSVAIIYRRPNRDDISRMSQSANNSKAGPFGAAETFVKDCVVFPDRETMTKVFTAAPGLVMEFSSKILEKSTFSGDALEKKL